MGTNTGELVTIQLSPDDLELAREALLSQAGEMERMLKNSSSFVPHTRGREQAAEWAKEQRRVAELLTRKR